MGRYLPGIAVIFVLLASLPAPAATLSTADMLAEKSMGRADAPVTIIEYASLGCPHCAKFHSETLPKIKEHYIDTGKVRMVYRDFPLGTPALAAAMIARCAGPERYFGMIDILFRSQRQWSTSQNPMAELQRAARFGGMAPADVDSCFQNQELLTGIQGGQRVANEQHGINSTPSFIIEGKVYEGALEFESFKKIIDAALNE